MFAASTRRDTTHSNSHSSRKNDVEIHDGRRYPHRLNFYNQQPQDDVTLEEFEEFAIARLRMIAVIESAQIRSLPHSQLQTMYRGHQDKYLPLHSNSFGGSNPNAKVKADADAERRKDVISHFVLRLAFCGSEELRRRFLRAETKLFQLRFEDGDSKERQTFLSKLSLGWEEVLSEEKKALGPQLKAALPVNLRDHFEKETYYKVPWTRVPDLVAQRKVYLQAGKAYVPQREQLSLILQAFSERLEQGLELTAKYLPRMDEDARLLPILNHLSLSFLAGSTAAEYSFGEDGSPEERVTAAQVEHLAPKHFPPCMRNLWNVVRDSHHLKHYARLQLGLFLKGIGLSVEEALAWWRRAFLVGSKMTDDKFKKEYEYNIKHSFGLVGSKINYQPKNCQRILTQDQPGTQDIHGCPFRHFSPDRLQLFLEVNYGIAPSDMGELLGQVKSQHYHVACTRVFELTHVANGVKKGEGLGGGESVDHPNRYFDKSWSFEKQANDRGGDVSMDDSTLRTSSNGASSSNPSTLQREV